MDYEYQQEKIRNVEAMVIIIFAIIFLLAGALARGEFWTQPIIRNSLFIIGGLLLIGAIALRLHRDKKITELT